MAYKTPWHRQPQNTTKRAARLARREPTIYFFRCQSFVKIGWSTDPAQRVVAVQSSNPYPVSCVACMYGGDREEIVLHRAFRPLSHRAEWFREEGPLAELIGMIGGLEPIEARVVTGDWFLKNFGKTELLFDGEAHKNRIRTSALRAKYNTFQIDAGVD